MNITTCTKTGDWTWSANISGTFTTPALSSNKTYTLTCQNNLWTSVLKTVSVNVTTPTSPTVLFGVSGGNTKVTPWSTITLQWTSTNATSCSLFFSTRETNGTQIVSPTKNERYDLSCVSADGVWVTQYVWVSMVYNTPTLTLSASKSSVSPGENVILTWSSANATTCTAWGGWSGSKAISWTESVSVSLTTEYTLTCSNPQYNITQTVTINIVLTFVWPEGDELVTAEWVVCVRNRVDKKIACWGNNNSSTYPWYPYLWGTNHDITAFTVWYVQDWYGQWPTNVIWRNNNGELTHLSKDGRNCTTTFWDQNCYTWAGGGNIAKLANGLWWGECRLYTDWSVWCEWQWQTVPSNLGSTVKDVSVWWSYVCALKTDNTVRCWSNGGNPASNNTPSNLTNVAQISSGKNHFCALQYDGTFQCWGNYTYSSTISWVRDVIKITAGTVATCVLKASHVVKCFGLVDPPAEINSNVIDVSARGNNYACLTQSDGSVRCWGGNVPNGTPNRIF